MSSRNRTSSSHARFRDEDLANPMGHISGGRDANGRQIAYKPDPVRDRALSYNGGGYLSSGYDSGRVY